MINLDLLLRANAVLLADLDHQLEVIAEREAKAARILEECATGRQQVERERQALAAVSSMYRARFVPDDDAPEQPPLEELRRQMGPIPGMLPVRSLRRARIGKQRYRMLAFLREHPDTMSSIGEIATGTDLSHRRVRDQMRSDVFETVVIERDDCYQITPSGLQHLNRFESYKRQKGQPLPPLNGPISDEDEDEDPSSETLDHDEEELIGK